MNAETAFAVGFILLSGMLFLMALGSFVAKVGVVLERLVMAYKSKGRLKE